MATKILLNGIFLSGFHNLSSFTSLLLGHVSCFQGYSKASCYPLSRLASHEWSLFKNGLGTEAFLALIISSGLVVASNTNSGTG